MTVADGACLCLGRVCALVDDPCFFTLPGKVGIEGADAILEPCSVATAAGDGRELWQLSQKYASCKQDARFSSFLTPILNRRST